MNIFSKLINRIKGKKTSHDPYKPDYMNVSVGGKVLYRCCSNPKISDYSGLNYVKCYNCNTTVYATTAEKRAELWNLTIETNKNR